MAILEGSMIDPALAKKILEERWPGENRQLDPRIFKTSWFGARILVLRDEAPDTYGDEGSLIHIPETVTETEPPGAGWVIAVGPDAGDPGGIPYPYGVNCGHASDLLGARVFFRMYGGQEFRTDLREGGFMTKFWVTTGRDLWALDLTD